MSGQMMKKLRKSSTLKAALSGIPSTEVLNATLTAYRYMIDPIKDMKQNLLPTGEGAVTCAWTVNALLT